MGFTITPALSKIEKTPKISHQQRLILVQITKYDILVAQINKDQRKYMSHGQSQSFTAATPLPKAMEYETIFKWRKASKMKILGR